MEWHCLFFLVQLPRLGTLYALAPDALVVSDVVRIQGPSECACTSPHRPSPTEQNPTRDFSAGQAGRQAGRLVGMAIEWVGNCTSGPGSICSLPGHL